MTTMIDEKFKPEVIQEFREKWVDIGLSTQKTDRAETERRIRKAYVLAGLPEPKRFLWLSSPLGAILTIATLRTWPIPAVSAQVSDQVSDQVRAQVRAQVSDQVRAQVRAQVSDDDRGF